MRVKNEEKYIRASLESLRDLGPVILLDDGSTDSTPDIVAEFDYVEYMRQDEETMDEGRDRTKLYRRALERGADWVFTLDGDEVLDPTTAAKMHAAVEKCPDDVNVFEMYLAVMSSPLGGPDTYYGPISPIGRWSMDRMFRVRDADHEYQFASNFESNLHCGCVPKMENRNKQKLNAFIKYYGYEDAGAIEKKREFYKKHDPENFPRTEQLWRERAKYRPIVWRDGLDCRDIGIHKTVTYI